MLLVLFIIHVLYKVVLTFKSVDETIVYSTIQLKAIDQYFFVVLFIMLYKVHVVLTGFNLSIHKMIPTS